MRRDWADSNEIGNRCDTAQQTALTASGVGAMHGIPLTLGVRISGIGGFTEQYFLPTAAGGVHL